MARRYAKRCSEECDFLILLRGHDFETIEGGFEAYDSCPTCGAELERVGVVEDRTGRLNMVELDEGDV